MLSKSQARLFFLAATVGFSGVFLFLTVDSLRQVPARSHEENLTEAVVRGKMIWESNNCMGCHTILGEGAYYAPELTRVVARRGQGWIKLFLKDPAKMFPGRRQMVQYNFTDAEIDDVVAFLDWVGKIDTNGFPLEPDLKAKVVPPPAQASLAPTARGPAPPALFTSVCMGCHQLGGSGGTVGPALDTVGDRYDATKMRAWLHDPNSIKPGTLMPNLNLSEADVTDLTTFLLAQTSGGAR